MSGYHLERLDEENAERWEAFHEGSTDGTLFHSLKWKRMAELRTGTPLQYFLLFRNEAVVGLFPFQDHTIYGFRGLVPASDPLSLHAVLGERPDPIVIRQAMDEFMRMYDARERVSFACVASTRPELFDAFDAYPTFPYPFSEYEGEGEMVIDLVRTPPDAIWDSFSNKKGQRKYIRRFDENGFGITDVHSEDQLRLFYTYYEENMSRIGGNHLPYSYFLELMRSGARPGQDHPPLEGATGRRGRVQSP